MAVYLLVAGVSADAFAISALAYFLGEEKYREIIRIGAYIAPFPLIFGLLFLPSALPAGNLWSGRPHDPEKNANRKIGR